MKRSQDRDASPRSKRSRSGYSGLDHDGGRDRLSPEMDRRGMDRGGGRSMSKMKYRDFDNDLIDAPRTKYRDDRISEPAYGPPSRSDSRPPDYRSLCISSISSKVPDHVLKETMYREFKKFGEFNVNVTYSGDQRVAYINFRYPEDARAAKHSRGKLILFDRPVRIESVYNKRRSNSPGQEFRDFFSGQSSPTQGNSNNNSMNRRPPPPSQPSGQSGGRGGYYDSAPPRDFPPRERQFNNFEPRRSQGNEKFPHHLEHIDPEDDDKATRTLFVGNLDYNMTDFELRKRFEPYGPIEEIDIKRPQKGQGNAYAFIKYMNLDCAHRAKVEMSGKYIGRFQCKIGYGKVTPSNCLWVGGLGPWVTHQTLEREFDRFGVIHRIEWPQGKSYAYVLYDNIDAAQAAIMEMRGFPLGGQDRRLRVDFADASHIGARAPPTPPRRDDSFDDRRSGFDNNRSDWRGSRDQFMDDRGDRRRDDWDRRDDPISYRNQDHPRDSDRDHRDEWDKGNGRRQRSPSGDRKMSRSPDRNYGGFRERDRDRENGRRHDGYSQDRDMDEKDDYRRYSDHKRMPPGSGEPDQMMLDNIGSLTELTKCLPVAWNGALVLKSSAFPARMHVVSGDVTIVDTLMRDPTSTETPVLKVKQRLRLDPSKTEDVSKRVSLAGPRGHCILLAMPSTLQNYEDPTGSTQQRPLKNLVTYLKLKESAGVISLPPYDTKDKDKVGLLHAFPPCQFGYEYLLNKAPKLPLEPIQEDYLVIIVVRGAV